MITEAKCCGDVGGYYMMSLSFSLHQASRNNADFSRLKLIGLFMPQILAYENRKQSCPNYMLSDYTVQECALYIPMPSPTAGVLTEVHKVWHFIKKSYQEKHSKNFDMRLTGIAPILLATI